MGPREEQAGVSASFSYPPHTPLTLERQRPQLRDQRAQAKPLGAAGSSSTRSAPAHEVLGVQSGRGTGSWDGASRLESSTRPRSGHGSLTTVVYKVQITPVDSSDAQISNPVTAKHTSCQASSFCALIQGPAWAPGRPAPPPPASQTLVQDECGCVDHDACVQHLWVGRDVR